MAWRTRQWGLFIGLVALDQCSKAWANQQGWVVLNPGVSFSLLAEIPTFWLTLFLIILAGLAARWWFQTWPQLPLASVFFWAGATSNLFDRLLFGGVRDWLPLPLLLASKNNLADWFITVGVLLLLVNLVHKSSKNRGTIKAK